jgi:hypothetical protein
VLAALCVDFVLMSEAIVEIYFRGNWRTEQSEFLNG